MDPPTVHAPSARLQLWDDPVALRRLAHKTRSRRFRKAAGFDTRDQKLGISQPRKLGSRLPEDVEHTTATPAPTCHRTSPTFTTPASSASTFPATSRTPQLRTRGGGLYLEWDSTLRIPAPGRKKSTSSTTTGLTVPSKTECLLFDKPKADIDLVLDMLGISEFEFAALIGCRGDGTEENTYIYDSPSGYSSRSHSLIEDHGEQEGEVTTPANHSPLPRVQKSTYNSSNSLDLIYKL